MIAAIASAALLVAASLIVGQAVLSLAGRPRATLLSGPVGLAALLLVAGIVAGWGGRGTAIGGSLVVLVLASAVMLIFFDRGSVALAPLDLGALASAALAALAAAIPFIAAGHVGILGVGLVNDDMASHLLLADWLDERFRPEPVLIDQGYPIGPHALVAGVSELLGARSIDVFAGIVLAIPALTALVAYSVLERLRPIVRVAASALVALPYMAAAYLAQEAFKEPIIALFLLAFALSLPAVRTPRQAIPLGVLAAGTVYVYSFPGLAWLGGVAVVWGAIQLLGHRGERSGRYSSETFPRSVWVAAGVGVLTLAVLTAPDADRLRDFADFRALDPDRANEGGLGNLRDHISPLEALGVWPTGEFRLSATASSLPAVVFYAGALLAAGAFVAALPRWLRRHGTAIPAALLTAALLYLAARGFGTVYTSAKALAIAAPFIALVTLGGLLGSTRRVLRALAALFAIAAAASSFLILRQAPVAPEDHMEELAEIRPLVEGEKLLFLGRDNFVLHSLRGSKPFTSVRNFYDPYFVQPNLELEQAFSKFDFDAVTAKTLARFPYALTTRAAYASGPPPGYEVVIETPTYALWRRGGEVGDRVPAETGPEPGSVIACGELRGARHAVAFVASPRLAEPWSATTIDNDSPAAAAVQLPAGSWDISLQYDATRPLTLSGPGFEQRLPRNLDYRGTTPYLPAGRIEVERPGRVEIVASVEDPPLAGRLLGARSTAHLGGLAFTDARGSTDAPRCGDYVDWLTP